MRDAVSTLAGLILLHPDITEYRVALGNAQTNLAQWLKASGRLPEAEKVYGQALATLRKVIEQAPDQPGQRLRFAEMCENFGELLRQAGRTEEAKPVYREGLEAQEAVVSRGGAAPEIRVSLARRYFNYARLVRPNRAEAEKSFQRALELFAQLAKEQPTVPDHRQGLARCYHGLGVLYANAKQFPEARKAFEKALRFDPDHANARSNLKRLLAEQNRD
jgi:tetratricopeptide (TPR) repeat protein